MHPLAWPLLVGLLLRVTWVLFIDKSLPAYVMSGDQYSYWVIGREIAAGHGYQIPPSTAVTSYYPVGFPALLGALYFVLWHTPLPDSTIFGTLALQITSSLASIALVWLIARRIWGAFVATVAAWIVALWPNLVMSVGTYSVETTFIFLVLASTTVVVTNDWSASLPSTRRLIAFGVVLGAAVLVRPFAIVVLIGVGLACLSKRPGWRNSLRPLPSRLESWC